MGISRSIYTFIIKLPKWTTVILLGFVFIALFRHYIANDLPLYTKVDGAHYFPILSKDLNKVGIDTDYTLYRTMIESHSATYEVLPLIPYNPSSVDQDNIHFVSPFGAQKVKSMRFRHFLGTDQLGRDVLAGIIHGSYTALIVSLFSSAIAVMIGLFFGLIAGFFQDDKWKMNRASMLFWIVGVFFILFYCFYYRRYQLLQGTLIDWLLSFFLAIISFLIFYFIDRSIIQKLKIVKRPIPLDIIIMRLVESFNAIPLILIIYVTLAMFEKSTLIHVIWLIGLTRWPTIARFIRAEVLHIRNQNYITAAIASGLPNKNVILNHTLPNAISPIVVTIAFSMSSAIALESTLSFLGIGIPTDVVSWGSIIQSSRVATDAWWVAVFPGIAIFLLIIALNKVAEVVNK